MTQCDENLRNHGWNEEWQSACGQLALGESVGRVVRAGRLLRVYTERGEVLASFGGEALDHPACGDWVRLRLHTDTKEGLHGDVRCVLERRNAVVRKAAGNERPQVLVANVDRIWLVCGLDRDQGLRSLPRYQAVTRLDGVAVSVVLNKVDLAEDVERDMERARDAAPGLEVFAVSARSGAGFAALEREFVRGQTIALIGPSGAGKSSLINVITAGQQATGEVRLRDGRGRHTTSAGELVVSSAGVSFIDTPGLREVALFRPEGLSNSYADIFELAKQCRFNDCRHDGEPGCEVRRALESGTLGSERFLDFLELCREANTPKPKRRRPRHEGKNARSGRDRSTHDDE